MDCSTPGFPVHHQLPELAQTPIESVMPSNHLITCHPLLSSVFARVRVFSSEPVLHIRWPACWSFSISPSTEYSGLISCRIDWFDRLAVQRTLEESSPTPQYKNINGLTLRICPAALPYAPGLCLFQPYGSSLCPTYSPCSSPSTFTHLSIVNFYSSLEFSSGVTPGILPTFPK